MPAMHLEVLDSKLKEKKQKTHNHKGLPRWH